MIQTSDEIEMHQLADQLERIESLIEQQEFAQALNFLDEQEPSHRTLLLSRLSADVRLSLIHISEPTRPY